MRWRVDVCAPELGPNVQLDFHADGTSDKLPTPTVSAGDTGYLVFPDHDRLDCAVISANAEEGVLKIAGAHWVIRRAKGEDVIPPPKGTTPIVWLIGARVYLGRRAGRRAALFLNPSS